MKTHLLFAPAQNQQNLSQARQLPRPSARCSSRARLAMETLEPRALLTASPAFAACAWMDTVPESVWMATCHAADSTASCSSTAAAASVGATDCSSTIKTVSVCGESSAVCVDSPTDCAVQDGNTCLPNCKPNDCVPKDCTPNDCVPSDSTPNDCTPSRTCDPPPCESKPKCESETPNCPQQESMQAKIAAVLRRFGFDCNFDKPATAASNCDPVEKCATVKRSSSSCDPNPPQHCGQPQSNSQRYCPDKTDVCRPVERCPSVPVATAAAVWARYR